MSRENVAVVRKLVDGWHGGRLNEAYEFLHPDIEWDSSRMAQLIPDIAGVFHGHDGVRAFWRRWLSAWKDLQFEVQDILDAGDDVVLLIHNQRQWGRHSGIETEVPPYAHIYSFREGQVVRWRCDPDQSSALEDVGLEQGGAPKRE
jgi:ketosteroid isomerase-like protein